MIVKNHKDAGAGLLITAAGLAFSVGASRYALGTASAMGPGYVPFGLGLLLTLIGLVILLRSLKPRAVVLRIDTIDPKVVLAIIGPIVLFGLLLDALGMVGAIAMLVLLSAFASHELGVRQSLISAGVIAVLCVGVFAVALRVQVPILPALLRAG